MPTKHRRVVTGHDAKGNSIILMDGYAPNSVLLEKAGGLQRTELWETHSCPADNSGNHDAAEQTNQLEPQPGGSIFRIIEYPPDNVRLQSIDPAAHFGAAAALNAHRHPGMHRTNTVDYAIVLSGEIYAVLDKDEVLLRAGDCLIQRGTSHAWSNRTKQPCLIAFVLLSALPVK